MSYSDARIAGPGTFHGEVPYRRWAEGGLCPASAVDRVRLGMRLVARRRSRGFETLVEKGLLAANENGDRFVLTEQGVAA